MMSIKILPPQLANQIAAGEVVERPSSIIKELVENSIDAKATEIAIELSQGGKKRIFIRDNGSGIPKNELALALERHATSKISNLDDLESITSMGFRGEALASISSVSRMTLNSKPQDQTEGWQVYTEGRDAIPSIKPIAHQNGSSIEVLDLFFNTPARKRFLKSDKTELTHILELVKRIALAYSNIEFSLSHNGKMIHHYKARKPHDNKSLKKWLSDLCGAAFVTEMTELSFVHDDLELTGYLSLSTNDLHYFYVNNRIVKDKVIHHAIKQAFNQVLGENGLNPSYVLYFTIDPRQVDVNVHPAKHEVRFHEARLIHDFICFSVTSALHQLMKNRNAIPPKIQSEQASQCESSIKPTRTSAGQNIFDLSPNRVLSLKTTSPHKTNEQRIYSMLLHSDKYNEHQDVNQSNEEQAHFCVEQAQQNTMMESLFPIRTDLNKDHEPAKICPMLGRLVALIDDDFALLENSNEQNESSRFMVVSLQQLDYMLFSTILKNRTLNSEPMIIPYVIKISPEEAKILEQHQLKWAQFGFKFEITSLKLMINAVPKLMRETDWQQVLSDFFTQAHQMDTKSNDELSLFLFNHHQSQRKLKQIKRTKMDVVKQLNEFEQYLGEDFGKEMDSSKIQKLIKPVDLSALIEQFKA